MRGGAAALSGRLRTPGGAAGGLWLGGEERRGEALVEGEEEFHALAVGGEGLLTITLVNRSVEVSMRLDQIGGHGQRIVEIGQRGERVPFPRIEDGLRLRLHGGLLFRVAGEAAGRPLRLRKRCVLFFPAFVIRGPINP